MTEIKDFSKELEQKYKYYQEIKKRAEKSLKKTQCEGHLRVAERNGKPQYYLVSQSGDTKGKYLAKKDWKIAEKLAQRDYEREVLKYASAYCKQIERFFKGLPDGRLNTIHLKSKGRINLIKPYELSDEEYIRNWEAVVYEGKGFDEKAAEIYTNRGERVRSKSEKIIADKLYMMRIPYRYEYPMELKGYGKVYPDFTLLDIRSRKEIILEHLGMMDDPEYCSKAVKKIHGYEQNGIFLGMDLLITSETSYMPLNTKNLELLLARFFYEN